VPVFRLTSDIVFPPPEHAEPNGLLAVGGDLSPVRLLNAYRQGIFPWYAPGEPLLWWSPSPRLVLFPEHFHLSRRLARTLRGGRFTISADRCFDKVMVGCAQSRLAGGESTWITGEMREAYGLMHRLGYAHSLECWQDDRLVGGLYGLALDRMFFGESMFSLVSDASKAALAVMAAKALDLGISCIDCQMRTDHLLSLGARELDRHDFQLLLRQYVQCLEPRPLWGEMLRTPAPA